MRLLGWLLLIPLLAFRFVLGALGLVLVPFTNPETNPVYGNREDPHPREWFMPGKPEWLRDYVWRAIRNPTNNLRYLIEQPIVYAVKGAVNPDITVRVMKHDSAYRLVQQGIFVEYWYLRACEDGEYFEFRLGWKFSGVPGFAPTIQLRKGS